MTHDSPTLMSGPGAELLGILQRATSLRDKISLLDLDHYRAGVPSYCPGDRHDPGLPGQVVKEALQLALDLTTYQHGALTLVAGSSPVSGSPPVAGGGSAHHGLDTDDLVCFYEQEFYPLSNFSAFTLQWAGHRFDTSEAAYHWEKFVTVLGEFAEETDTQRNIRLADSAHDAFRIARDHRDEVRADWDRVKVNTMRKVLRAKARQHEYVRRKLLQTGTRLLVENSWRDDFWGWGPDRSGKNVLGVLWMEIRDELRAGDAIL